MKGKNLRRVRGVVVGFLALVGAAYGRLRGSGVRFLASPIASPGASGRCLCSTRSDREVRLPQCGE